MQEKKKERTEEMLEAEYVRSDADIQRAVAAHALAQAYSRLAYVDALSQYGRGKEKWMRDIESKAYEDIFAVFTTDTGRDVIARMAPARGKMKEVAATILRAAYGALPEPDEEYIRKMKKDYPYEMEEMTDCLIVEQYKDMTPNGIYPPLLLHASSRIADLDELLLLRDGEKSLLVSDFMKGLDEEMQKNAALLAAVRISEDLPEEEDE